MCLDLNCSGSHLNHTHTPFTQINHPLEALAKIVGHNDALQLLCLGAQFSPLVILAALLAQQVQGWHDVTLQDLDAHTNICVFVCV